MSDPILELQNVSKWYESDPDRRVLDGIDLQIEEGQRFSIVGSSGCGKSTLLNLMGTLDSPSEGQILFNGEKLVDSKQEENGSLLFVRSEKDLAALRSEQIGFIFQLHHLLPQCSAMENVLVPTLALPNRPDASKTEKRAKNLFKEVGLENKIASKPGQLSGGERQRVAVIRALINQPKIVLADEPTGALDEENATTLVDLLVKLNDAEGLALVMVTHDHDLAERLGEIRTLGGGKLKKME